MSKAIAFVKKELLELLPPTIFFLVVFYLVVFTRSLIRESEGIPMRTYTAATVGALVVGKAILIADALPAFRWFREKRLIFNVAWRTLLYLVVALLLQTLEELGPRIPRDGLTAAIEGFVDETPWTLFWATHLLFATFLAIYSLLTAMIEIIGRERFLAVFFGWNRRPG
jgi:hypothetical protein